MSATHPNPEVLLPGYLDDTLSPEEFQQFSEWLRASPEHTRRLAAEVLLHDRLSVELMASEAIEFGASESADQPSLSVVSAGASRSGSRPNRERTAWRSLAAWAGVSLAMSLLLFTMWSGLGEIPVAAAAVELDRLIKASELPADRTYQITVEETAWQPAHGYVAGDRPPKPPMEDAMLHVRGDRQFVLVRRLPDGGEFITGCDGELSWAVNPKGVVRTSADLRRFSRDVPGHEHEMPLNNLHDGLAQLRNAFEVRLLPIEETEGEPIRLLVAVKKRGTRGPRRVEITYAVSTGQIQQLRFIDMPYGADRLTLRLTLAAEPDLGPDFFHHTSHHAPDRRVVQE